MKILKGSIFVVIITLICFFKVDVVNASEYLGYIYEAETIDDIYFYTYRSDTDKVTYPSHNFHTQATIYRRSLDNDIVYCIENWAKLTGAKRGDYEETYVFNNYTNHTKLTKEQISRIELIGYFGYGYKDEKYDHTDKKWYAITQYLIWKEEKDGSNIYFVNDIESTTPIYPFNKEIKEIEDLVKRVSTFPNFGSETLVHKTYEPLRLTATEDIEKKDTHFITGRPSKIDIDGKKMTITPDIFGDALLDLTIYRQGSRFDSNSVLYTSDEFQDTISIGNYLMLSKNYPIMESSGILNLYVYCENVDSYSDKFNYRNNSCFDTNVLIYAEEDTYDDLGELIFSKDQLVVKTNEYSVNLYPGKYYMKPETKKDGYLLPIDHFEVGNGQSHTAILIYKLQKANLSATKYKETFEFKDNGVFYDYVLAPNIKFGLYAGKDIVGVNDKIIFNKDDLITTITTNSLGELIYDGEIPYGSYYLKELENDPLYQLDDNEYYFTFAMNGDESVVDIVLDNMYNDLLKGLIDIYVKDFNTNLPLSPITIFIYDKDNNLIYIKATDEFGNVSIELPYGEYYVKQSDGLPNYTYSNGIIMSKLYSEHENILIYNKLESNNIPDSDNNLPSSPSEESRTDTNPEEPNNSEDESSSNQGEDNEDDDDGDNLVPNIPEDGENSENTESSDNNQTKDDDSLIEDDNNQNNNTGNNSNTGSNENNSNDNPSNEDNQNDDKQTDNDLDDNKEPQENDEINSDKQNEETNNDNVKDDDACNKDNEPNNDEKLEDNEDGFVIDVPSTLDYDYLLWYLLIFSIVSYIGYSYEKSFI